MRVIARSNSGSAGAGALAQRGRQVRVLAAGRDVHQVAGQRTLPLGGVLAGPLLADLGLREQPDRAGEQPDRLQLLRPGQAGAGQRGQRVLDEGHRVRPGQAAGGRDVQQPRVPVVDGPPLLGQL